MADPRLIYADSEHCADMLYATGLFVPDPFLWCSVRDETFVVMSPLEVSRARQHVRAGTHVLSFAEAKRRFKVRTLRPANLVAGISRHYAVKRWDVPPDFPFGIAQDLIRKGLTLRTPKDGFFPERETKRDDEIARITHGVRLAEAGLNRGLGILREAGIDGSSVIWNGASLTAGILRGEIDAEISRLGGIAAHTIVAPGVRGADPHDDGGDAPILAHQSLILDIFPRVTATGYWGDLTRTVVKGQAPDILRRAYTAVRDARDLAKSMIKSRITGKTVHDAVHKSLKDAGFETDAQANPPYGFFHGTGHGLGLQIHEAPRVSSADNILRAGQVVTVEPGVYYPDWGGVRLEDVVVVETKGCRCLTSVPDELEIP